VNTHVTQLYYVAHNDGKLPCQIYLNLDKASKSEKLLIDVYNVNGDVVETYKRTNDGAYLKD